MATRDESPATYKDALAELGKAAARVKRARRTLEDVEAQARVATGDALRLGQAEGIPAFRTEVQQQAPFSPPVVRAIGESEGVAPDDRYRRFPRKAGD